MGKLAGYKISNIEESFTNSVDVTSYPVEKGLPITDGVKRQPKTFSISGHILAKTHSDAMKVYNALEKKQNSGTIVTYVGRTTAKNVIITSMNPSFNSSIANGMDISINLQEIRIAKSPYVKKKTTKKQSGKKSKSNKKKSKKVYHKVKRGDTYWGLSRKYGTPIPTLRKWNKYPDRRIPLNVKLRVK
ncbi:LysM domain-containing protein [Heyndrickxia sporothermodurans]|uniref:LysM domain-containing protein n=1 Tax=Heyndrickxia sporothermodurans TaxID=46224 RepID=UPI002E1BA0E2|nr:LysM domain-containing protein [Heyndrickxia sporothermodurans]